MQSYFIHNNISADFRNVQSSNIYHIRDQILLQEKESGHKNVKPFGGEHYDYFMFIDSDQVWDNNDIDTMIKTMEARPDIHILSGVIKAGDGVYAQGFQNNKGTTYRLFDEWLDRLQDPFEVDFIGCGFVMIRRGVLEAHKWPWFGMPEIYTTDTGDNYSFGEDVSFFFRCKKLGYKLYVHPKLKIGHEKTYILK